MPHEHNIVDTSGVFSIDPITRVISTASDVPYLVQGDHKSDRFTFEIPRFIEGHDMYQSDEIEIHYTNITKNKKEQNDNVYYVQDDDIIVTPDDVGNVKFTWLISGNATQLIGKLNFSITFVCLDPMDNRDYEWSTKTFEGVQVLPRLNHTHTVQEAYPDFYEKLKKDVTPEKGKDYWTPEEQQYIIENSKGEPGHTPERGKDYWTPDDQVSIVNQVLESLPTWEGGSY